MAIRRIKYYIALLFCLGGLQSNAQDTTINDGQLWSLEQCLEYAKANNISINSLRLDKATSQQNLIASKAAVLPNLSGSFSQNLYNQSGGSDAASSLNSSGSIGLSSSMTLYQGGYLRNDIKQKNLSLQSAGLSVAEAENSIALQITQAYLNILLDKETIVYAEDLVETSQAQVDQMKKQFEVGAVAKKDLIQLEAQLASDQYTLTNAQNTERQDKLTLKQLLQLPVTNSFEIQKPDSIFTASLLPSINEVMDVAMTQRPEIENAKLNVQIANLDVKKALAGYKPTVSLTAGLGTSYGNNITYATSLKLNSNLYQQLGVTVSVPIFSRKVNRTSEAKARISVLQAELNLNNVKTTLSQSVEKAYITAQNASSQFDASLQQLAYNREAFKIAGQTLEVGSSNTVEYVQQKNLYIQALQTYTQAKYSAVLSVKIFEFYKGEPLSLQ